MSELFNNYLIPPHFSLNEFFPPSPTRAVSYVLARIVSIFSRAHAYMIYRARVDIHDSSIYIYILWYKHTMWKRACMFLVPRKYSRFSLNENVNQGNQCLSRHRSRYAKREITAYAFVSIVPWTRYDEHADGETRQLLDNSTRFEIFPCPPISKRNEFISSFGQFGQYLFNRVDSNFRPIRKF